MHPLHEYVARQLADRLKTRKVVVWYDPPGDFRPFIAELGGAPSDSQPGTVTVEKQTAQLAEYSGSYFELRSAVEPLVSSDTPAPLVVYLPGCQRDPLHSVLMELERAGTTWEPQLKQLARNVLLKSFTQGVVDELLPFDRPVTYQDLARAAQPRGNEPPSILRSLFHPLQANDAILAAWLASEARDEEIAAKQASPELLMLLRSWLGLDIAAEAPLGKLRAIAQRYVLAGEFRSDLRCSAPSSLDAVPRPADPEHLSAVRELAARMRASHADSYAALADRLEDELGLRKAGLPADALGAIDTFRFEEQALLSHCGDLIARHHFEQALELVLERSHSFWLDRDVERKAHWEACRRMAELGQAAACVSAQVKAQSADALALLEAYTTRDGWYRLDQAQRRLETWVATLPDDCEERPLNVVRRLYEDTCHLIAERFTRALEKLAWAVPVPLHQTKIFSQVVAEQPKPVAYFLVDAMRFEMGVELAERLPGTSEVSLAYALGVLPSITPIGMASLQPGASASFSVVETNGKLGALIEDSFLPDLASRKKFAAARLPKLVDLTLDELLTFQASKLKKKLEGAQVVMVRSQEIDHAGETGFMIQARHAMETVIDNLARALRKLAGAGVHQAVVTADHGHLFFGVDREPSMRTDAPGGAKVELHRRCWIGRGGATPSGCVRVSATALGYASDLDFIFPMGSAVFKAGGDLAYHHGGPSLQELVIPVLTVRTRSGAPAPETPAGALKVTGLPELITNRIFSVGLLFGEGRLVFDEAGISVRPILMQADKQVGSVGMAVDAPFDRATGCVTLEPNKPITVAFLLTDDQASKVRVIIQDPATDAVLYKSLHEIPVKLGV